MKSSSLTLFKLIKSLSKSEKRYLKLGLINKQTEHLKLFDAIVKQDSYNEDLLKAENSNAPFAKNMAVYKSYLYKYILNRLSQFHKNSKEAVVFEKIRFAEILMNKKLFKEAKKQLKSAQKLASQHELSELLLVVFKYQKNLLQKEKSNFESIQNLYQDQKETIHILDLNTRYSILFNEISYLQISIQKAQNSSEIQDMETWRKNPLLNTTIGTLSLQNSILVLKSMAIYHFTKGEVLEASEYNKQLLDLLEKEIDYNKSHPEQYISILNNYVIDQLTLKNIAAFENGLLLLEQLPSKPVFKNVKNIKVRIFHQRFLLLFNYCFSEKKYSQALAEIPSFKKQFLQFEELLQKHQRLTLNYLAAVLSFAAGDYKEAQYWIFPILQETKEDVVQAIFKYARLLNLLIHLELKNDEFIHSLLPATQRAFSKQKKVYQSEQLIFQFFKKIISSTSRKEKLNLKEKLKEELVQLKNKEEEKRLFEYIPILDWLSN